MSNPNQFNSPQNPSGPGQVPPVGPSQYSYPSNQGTDSQQAPGYQYPQYGQPYQALGAASPDGYGGAYQGQHNPHVGYQYPQNQTPAGAASYGYAQPAPSPGEEATAPTQRKKRSLATSVGGSVDTDTQAASWTLTARLPAAAGAPS